MTVVDRGAATERCSYGNAGSVSSGSVAPLAMPGLVWKVPGLLLDSLGPFYLRPSYAPRAVPWLFRFLLAAQPDRVEAASCALRALLAPATDALRNLAAGSGAENLFRTTGQLQLYPNNAALQADAAIWNLRRSRGVRAEILSKDEIRQLEPGVGGAYTCAVFLPDEGMVLDPQRQLEALTKAFVRGGGRLLVQNCRGIDVDDVSKVVLALDGDRLVADRVIVAAGAWSHRLAAQVGDPVPLETQRGYHVTIMDAGVDLRRPVVAADRKCFATPLAAGLRIAGTVEFAGLEAPPDYRRARALLEHGRRLLPSLRTNYYTEWMGHRPCLPDSLPVISSAARSQRLFYAFGHGHLGLTGAAVTGELIAALAAGRPPSIDLHPFRVDRF